MAGLIRNLVLVLGDQLDEHSAAFDGFDPKVDAVWMAEVMEESTKVWSSKMRTAFFLSAMRHFAETLRGEGMRMLYMTCGDKVYRRETKLSGVKAWEKPVRVGRPGL